MSGLSLSLLLAALGGPAAPASAATPTDEQVRKAVERSVPFLESEGVGWMREHHCTSCHQVPMTIWSLSEAEKYGFAIDREEFAELRTEALATYTRHPDLKPAGQDGKGKGVSRNTSYLTLAATATPTLDETTAAAVKKFAAHLLATQEADGSWKLDGGQPPVVDSRDIGTTWALLALAAARRKGIVADSWPQSRDRALAWLGKQKRAADNQSLVLQVLVEYQFGKPAECRALVEQLVRQQNADSGWGQVKDRPSDAYATGQTLYALTTAGLPAQDPALQRARGFLLKTQRADGSWLVTTRLPKAHNIIISYTGTAWATIGLLRTLPMPPAVKVPPGRK